MSGLTGPCCPSPRDPIGYSGQWTGVSDPGGQLQRCPLGLIGQSGQFRFGVADDESDPHTGSDFSHSTESKSGYVGPQ